VTYELAAGALLAIFYLVRDSWIAGVFGSLVAGLGVWLYLKYLPALWSLWHHSPVADIPEGDRPSRSEKVFFFVSIVPLTSLVAAAIILWMRVPVEASEWFAAACTWLVFSGTMQAILWYLASWEPSRSPVCSDGER